MDGSALRIRAASPADVAALGELRPPPAVHRDRVRDASGGEIRYLLAEEDEKPIGFIVLVLKQPPSWPLVRRLPQVLDLYVAPSARGHGCGRRLVEACTDDAAHSGFDELWIAVDPETSHAAFLLYERLGFLPIHTTPVEERWQFTDSDGALHSGVSKVLYCRKALAEG